MCEIELKKIPLIRFRAYHEAWKQYRLGEISNRITRKNTNLESTRPLTISAQYGLIDQHDFFNKQVASHDISGYYLMENGEFAYNKSYSKDYPFGAVKRLDKYEKGVLSTLYIVFEPKRVNSDYLAAYYDSFKWHKEISMRAAEGARNHGLLNIAPQDFFETQLFVPESKDEQEKIGRLFEQIDNIITLYQRELELLQLGKRMLLSKMFPKEGEVTPEIRFRRFTGDWEWHKLGENGQTYSGLSGKTKEDFGHGQACFITYMNVFSNPVTNPEMTEPIEIDSKQNEVEVGDVFFTTSSETPEEVGMASVLLEKQGITYLNSFCFGFRPMNRFDSYFLAYMLRSQPTREKIILLAQGISRYNISKNKVMEIDVSIPSSGEQQRVGQFFCSIDHLITLHQRKVAAIKEMKKTLLKYMFV